MKFQCNSCGGIYQDVQSDGTAYYHVCSPEVIVRGAAALDALGNPIPDGPVPRVDGRDENIVVEYELTQEGTPRATKFHVKAEGKGRTPLPDAVV